MRSITAGMLVVWNRGFESFEMLAAVVQRCGHALSHLPAHVCPTTTDALLGGGAVGEISASQLSPS